MVDSTHESTISSGTKELLGCFFLSLCKTFRESCFLEGDTTGDAGVISGCMVQLVLSSKKCGKHGVTELAEIDGKTQSSMYEKVYPFPCDLYLPQFLHVVL